MKPSNTAPWLLATLLVVLAAVLLARSAMFPNAASSGIPATPAPNEGNALPAIAAPAWHPNATWQKPSDEQLKATLSSMQYQVTQHEGTEPPFNNEYWDNHQEGIYVDIVSGEPLFSSRDKYDSGTGWPSFTKPVNNSSIKTITDYSFGMTRTEVRSSLADSHLGHLFNDGPAPSYLRYCMNSAAMRFIPKDQMATLGYGVYLNLFNGS